MIQSTRNAADELASLLEADRKRANLPPPQSVVDEPPKRRKPAPKVKDRAPPPA